MRQTSIRTYVYLGRKNSEIEQIAVESTLHGELTCGERQGVYELRPPPEVTVGMLATAGVTAMSSCC